MRKQDMVFWALVVALIFGVALGWPLWARLIVILLAGSVLVEVSSRIFAAFGKEKNNGRE